MTDVFARNHVEDWPHVPHMPFEHDFSPLAEGELRHYKARNFKSIENVGEDEEPVWEAKYLFLFPQRREDSIQLFASRLCIMFDSKTRAVHILPFVESELEDARESYEDFLWNPHHLGSQPELLADRIYIVDVLVPPHVLNMQLPITIPELPHSITRDAPVRTNMFYSLMRYCYRGVAQKRIHAILQSINAKQLKNVNESVSTIPETF